MLTELVIGS